MHPSINFFGLQIDSYYLMLVVAVVAAVLLFRLLCDIDEVEPDTYNFFVNVGMASIVIGFVSAWFFDSLYKFFQTGRFAGGLTFLGGLVGGAGAFVLLSMIFGDQRKRAQLWPIANRAVFSVVAAHAIGRVGCFLAGCCYGVQTDWIFGVIFPPGSSAAVKYGYGTPVWPTNLFEAIFLAILGAVMFVSRRRQPPLLTYLFSYAVFRFLLEFVRGDERGAFLFGILSPSQVQSLLMLAIAIALTLWLRRTKTPTPLTD